MRKLKQFIERMVLMMAMLFACRLVDGRTASFDMIPNKLKAQVAEIVINDFGLPEMVPVEFGGTMA
jgi:lipoprotein